MNAKKQVSPKFESDHNFQKALRSKVNEVLGPVSRRDLSTHYLKVLIVLTWALGSYGLLYVSERPVTLVFLCVMAAVGHTLVGFNVFHDAVHGSLSNSKRINHFFSFLTCSILGVSHHLWRFKHNYLHHHFTNIEMWDDDLETREALRLSPYQKQKWQYRFQHYYAPFAYAMTSFEWNYIKDFVQYFTLKMNKNQKVPPFDLRGHIEFWLSKTIYFSLYLVLPFVYFDFPIFISGFILFHLTHSLFMASIFQLAHVMPDSNYYKPDSKKNEMPHFSKLQLLTTVNFAPESRIITWLSGGLNYQIEHHLFPKISHLHYPKISKAVKKVTQEFNLPYMEIDTYFQALKLHFQMLRSLGKSKKL